MRRMLARIVGPRAPAHIVIPLHEYTDVLVPPEPDDVPMDTVLEAMLSDDGVGEPLSDDEFDTLMSEAMRIEDDDERITQVDALMARWLPNALRGLLAEGEIMVANGVIPSEVLDEFDAEWGDE